MKYVEEILSGRTAACQWVRLACERHVRDLQRTDIVFNEALGGFAVDFIEFLPQSIGEFAGMPLKLEEWQKFIVKSIFGWLKMDGTRRYKKAYIEIPRKNGKTTLAAGIALYALIADGEEGAQVYFAATKSEQAAICFNEAVNMVSQNDSLSKHCKVLRDRIIFKNSVAKKISADKKQSGLNIHAAIIDELHEHQHSKTVDLVTTATGTRRNPLIFEITTSGDNTNSVCWEHHKLTTEILSGIKKNDGWFGVIYGLDRGDDIHDKANWAKANPNMGISKKWSYMEEQHTTAVNMNSYMNAFKQLDLNIWVGSHSSWVEDEYWTSCIATPNVEGRRCWGGLDMAQVRDFTAFTICFDVDGKPHFKRWFWIPEKTYQQRKVNANSTEIDDWIKGGWLKVTPGNALDVTIVAKDILNLHEMYNIEAIGFDMNKAETLQSLLDDKIEVYAYGQGYRSMSEPTKDLEIAYVNGNCTHDGSPVQRWMMGNVLIVRDDADNIKIARSKVSDKVDGVVSEIMAYGTMKNLINETFVIDPNIWRK